MERLFRDRSARKPGGGLKDRPQCDRCGRPVRIDSDDYTREEILCPACANETRISGTEDYESGNGTV